MTRCCRWLWLPAVALLLVACGQESSATSDSNKVRVVTSIGILADFVKQVGKDRVEVVSLLPSGADPHTFQLSPRDAKTISNADLIVLNGLGLEAGLMKVIDSARRRDATMLVMSEGLTPIEATENDDHADAQEAHEDGNPHFWLDVRYAMVYVERIRDGLAEADPQNADAYRSNAEAYLKELEALDREIEQTIASIPPQRRKLVAFHDSFAYLARRYGLEVVAYVIKSPGREPSAAEVAELAESIRREGVPVVFREPQLNARILELVAKDLGVKVSILYSDSLSKDVPTYIDMMRFNAQQLVENLR